MPDSSPLIRLRRAGDTAPGRPVFERVAIVGLDGAGAPLALATRRAWPTSLVIGVDRTDLVERAIRRHMVDVGSADLMLASEAELVVLASTPEANAATLCRLGDLIGGEAAVTDLGDRPRLALDAARVLPARLPLVAGQLVAETSPGTIETADPDWLSVCTWLFVIEPVGAPVILEKLLLFASGVGAKPEPVSESEFARRVASRGEAS